MRNCWLQLRKLFDRGGQIFKNFCVKCVNLEFVHRWHAHALCIRYAFASPSKVARLQESRSSAMSRLPRRRARPGAPGTPPLRTKARKKIGGGPVPSARESGGRRNNDRCPPLPHLFCDALSICCSLSMCGRILCVCVCVCLCGAEKGQVMAQRYPCATLRTSSRDPFLMLFWRPLRGASN